MTETPNKIDELHARIPEQAALMGVIAADAKMHAVAYMQRPKMGGELGKKWDAQAALAARIAAEAEIAAVKLGILAGSHPRMPKADQR
jgi:hypothetical protein